jgi:hypothetical protein
MYAPDIKSGDKVFFVPPKSSEEILLTVTERAVGNLFVLQDADGNDYMGTSDRFRPNSEFRCGYVGTESGRICGLVKYGHDIGDDGRRHGYISLQVVTSQHAVNCNWIHGSWAMCNQVMLEKEMEIGYESS